ncbi:hypothetical protein [Paenibacillus odorifer]|uniref:hypothetical protein n=1 Tax=Paenibacillus odorifer TaxID=189426 RepID=UPI00117C34CF|nr:hypothetical protein [Paenibacillus odorifer]
MKSVRYGTVAGCIWLRVYGTCEMDRADLHMVPLWKFAHGGLHVEICSCWDSLWKSAHVRDSMWKFAHDGDSIVQLSSVQYE